MQPIDGSADATQGTRGARLATKRMMQLAKIARSARRRTVSHRVLGNRYVERAAQLKWLARDICRAHSIRVIKSGDIPDGPAVLVANHLSYLDPIALASLAPCAPIAKSEIAEWPIFGPIVSDLGVLFVDRGDAYSGARTLRRSLSVLRSGVAVLAFPEGTTTHGDSVGPFHRGVFGAARIAKVPVIPIAIRLLPKELCWVDDDLFLPHYLKTAGRAQNLIEIDIGRPMDPHDYRTPDAAASATRADILRRLETRRRVADGVARSDSFARANTIYASDNNASASL